jgi:hypothetical protein
LAEDVPVDAIGEHLEVVAEGELIATHLFACLNPGYIGWRWAVNVTRVPDSDVVTVNETVLLPGNGSLLSPQWLPWDERVEAGDLGVGDVLPTAPDDTRLVPGYTGVDQDDTEDDDLVPVLWELGLGRVRVLSVDGREEAATRWADGDNGPNSPIAKAASEQCRRAFPGDDDWPLGRAFDCVRMSSSSDGKVVSGITVAHSEAEPEPPPVVVATWSWMTYHRMDSITELTDDELDATDEALVDSIEDEADLEVAVNWSRRSSANLTRKSSARLRASCRQRHCSRTNRFRRGDIGGPSCGAGLAGYPAHADWLHSADTRRRSGREPSVVRAATCWEPSLQSGSRQELHRRSPVQAHRTFPRLRLVPETSEVSTLTPRLPRQRGSRR